MSMAASPPRSEARRFVVMGVAGCGKSSVGAALAARLGMPYIDGDDLHPAANIAKMSSGQALTDADRWPWLAAVGSCLRDRPGIIGCSALRRAYRDHIVEAAGRPVTFLHLSGDRALIAARMRARKNHFMPPSLLDSQFATLEPPGPDENAVTVDIDQPLGDIVAELLDRIAP